MIDGGLWRAAPYEAARNILATRWTRTRTTTRFKTFMDITVVVVAAAAWKPLTLVELSI